MTTRFEPRIVTDWLEPLGLTLAALLEETATRQAAVIRFLMPTEGVAPTAEERAGLLLLGWAAAERTLAERAYRTILMATFDLFLALDESGLAAYVFEQAYPEPSDNSTYFEKQIELLLKQGRLDEAGQKVAQLQAHQPDSFLPAYIAARYWQRRGDFDQAIANYRQAYEMSPDSQRVWIGLAQCAIDTGKNDEARQWLEKFDETPAATGPIFHRIAQLWQVLGDSEQAARYEAARQAARQNQQAKLTGPATAEVEKDESSLEVVPELSAPMAGQGLSPEAFEVLRTVFGHAGFRPGQEQIISQVLAGQDTLAVLPTGAGKSLCYQMPAMLLSRPVLVLSPLISLMKDQFDKLPPALKEHTFLINSSLEPGEASRRLREMARPGSQTRLIYAAPERLRQRPFVQALEKAGLGLLVVDEAHCVTMWGNDFRPDYLFIRRVLTDVATPVLAVTATATPEIAAEIGRQLGRELKLVRGSVFRGNLRLKVEKVSTGREERYRRVAELCVGLEGSGIIYTRSRDKCDELAYYLNQQGIAALAYHAGLDNNERRTAQEAWNTGQAQIIVATIAFGMGIDKPDVRFIVHLSPPQSLENYTQEAGRAGRDGMPSDCIMLYTSGDKANLTRWLREERERLNLDALRAIYRVISRQTGRARRGVVPLMDLLLSVSDTIVEPDETLLRVGLSLLERAELLERGYDLPTFAEVSLTAFGAAEPDPSFQAFVTAVGLDESNSEQIDLVTVAGRLGRDPNDLELDLLSWSESGWLRYDPGRREPYIILKETDQATRARLESLLEQMRVASEQRLDHLEAYLKSHTCRQILIARHFGEKLSAACGQCDNCRGERAAPVKAKSAKTSVVVNASQPSEAFVTRAILQALGGAYYLPSRSGLGRILMGSEKATNSERQNPGWATLEGHLTQKKLFERVDDLITRQLIQVSQSETSFRGQTYEVYALSEAGRDWLEQGGSTEDEPPSLPPSRSAAKDEPDEETSRLMLEALRFLSPQDEARVGRTGLIRLLLGQSTALGTRSNNPYKGSLEGRLKQKEVERQLEKLIERGLIAEQNATGAAGMAYKALVVSDSGHDWLESLGKLSLEG